MELTKVTQKTTVVSAPPTKQCWVISRSRSKAVARPVRQAAWDFPLNKWDTWCGWHFAEKNVKVALVTKIPQGMSKCKKCETARQARDDVKGGVGLASLLSFLENKGIAVKEGTA